MDIRTQPHPEVPETSAVFNDIIPKAPTVAKVPPKTLAERYPQYYKNVSHLTEVDVYTIHNLFGLDDSSGCLHHASKKILLSGVRTGNKPKEKDIKEARDTLTRWLQINNYE